MGRLQRKKTPTVKKRKKQDSSAKQEAQKKGQPGLKTGGMFGGIARNSGVKQATASRSLSVKQKSQPGKIKTFLDKSLQFLREVKVELKKVTWPSRKQTLGSTVVVLILIMIISFFLGAVDIGLANILRVVLH